MEQTANIQSKNLVEIKPLRLGEIVQGKVIGVGRSAIYVDLSPHGTGLIYGREFLEEKDVLRQAKIGDVLAVKIVDLENDEGYIELSIREAGRELTWDKLQELKNTQQLVLVKVLGANKGGLLMQMQGIQAFLPVSQLSQEHYPKVEGGDPSKILRELQKFMGQELEVEILDLDPREGKVILSEKSKERSKIKEILSAFKVGDTAEGEITGIVEFGAFMRFPQGAPSEQQVEGLIHISEIDWQIIEDPSQFLAVGQKVKAKIIDLSNGRVSLSLKALKEDPWKEAAKKYIKLSQIQGRVTKLNPFGAFVEVEPKIQGLCHISEFGTKQKMEEELTVGKTYPFQIIEINPSEHRMSLHLIRPSDLAEKPDDAAQPQKEQQTEPQPEKQ
ncbi:MAG: S1 RNA-binding domain-containing protein [Candidatus Wildermuthbacteria bacterium]|nr:S1 RNA-binding domain-containing protein [Candidatus Wildermuthbacteria bacterium]